jgi:DNA replication initiation complex subunit (GINS family)
MQELKKNESTNALIKINQDIDKNEGSFIRDLRKMKEIFR